MRPRSQRHRCQCIVSKKLIGKKLSDYYPIYIPRPCGRFVSGQGRSYCCSNHSKQAHNQSQRKRSAGDTRRCRDLKRLDAVTPDGYEVIGYARKPEIFSKDEICVALADLVTLPPPMPFIVQNAFTEDGLLKDPGHGVIPTGESQNLLKRFYWVEKWVKNVGRKSQWQFAVHIYDTFNIGILQDILSHYGIELEQWRRSTRWVECEILFPRGTKHTICVRQPRTDVFDVSTLFQETYAEVVGL